MRIQSRSVPSLFAIAFLLMVSRCAFADGFIIIENPQRIPGHFPFAPLEISYHRVNVEVDDRVAVTTVDQEFRNPGNVATEGTYMFPLPPGAHIDKFAMDINGTQAEAELLSADKARAIYEEIVRKMRDPALLEYVGRDAFKVRIYPIEARGTKRIKIRYTQILKEDAGLVEYSYPLNTEKFSSRLIPDVSVTVKIKSPETLKSIYCPTHNAGITRDGPRNATVGYEQRNVRPDTDFKLIFSREKKDVGVKLLTYKRPGSEDGYFMLMASPGVGFKDSEKSAATAKDIVFVLDTSGSMADRDKLGQAKKALNFCLANLNEDDRFDIVRFSTEAEPLFGGLQRAEKNNVDKARAFVDGLKPTGGTAIDDGLAAALKLRDGAASKTRPFLMVFLTDGAPTVGVTNEDQIVKRATDRAADVRIFSFGIGHDVNTHLLDRLSDATRAASQYVMPDESIELKVSSFYAKVKEPVLTDVKLSFSGDRVKTTQLYPAVPPDLFKGETLLVFGRFSGDGNGSVKLGGMLNGKSQEFSEDVKFTGDDSGNAFIPTMWATRRVGWLLDEIRLHGESSELKDEIVRLARENGIVTPYTAYLIMEDESKRRVPALSRTFRELENDGAAALESKVAFDSARLEATDGRQRMGQQAVANGTAYSDLKNSTNLQQAQQGTGLYKSLPGGARGGGRRGGAGGGGNGGFAGGAGGRVFDGTVTAAPAMLPATQPGGYRETQNYAEQVRMVNGRAFYQNGSTWSDSGMQSQKQTKQQTIKFNSDEYFALLRAHPTAAQWLSLGNNVDLVLDDTLYSVRDD